MYKSKKLLSVLVCMVMLLTAAPGAAAAAAGSNTAEVSVIVNDDRIAFDVPPQIFDGTTFLPVRLALEPLGAEFDWNGADQTITIRANGKIIVLTIGGESALVDGATKPLAKPAMLVDGRTLIPIRFVAEELNYVVDWDDGTKTVFISSKAKQEDKQEDIDFVERVLELVNEERAKEGARPLTLDEDLCAVAAMHSEDMIARNFFSHENPDGASPFDRMKAYGISYRAAAENIAAGQTTPEQVMDSWMNSPGHRKNILNTAYGKIGIGIALGGEYRIYWTQCFTN